MKGVIHLGNWYAGPLMRQGHGPELTKPGTPTHGWHWLRKTDQGWESVPLVAEVQHFETPQQAIDCARARGLQVDTDPKFEYTFALPLPKKRAANKQ
jgi:hypothetical protein